MQRQSLGSPVSKLHSHNHGGPRDDSLTLHNDADDSKRKQPDLSSSSSSSISIRRRSSSPAPALTSDRLVHAIPIITLLCFLVLLYSSHSPSQSEMSQFKGFNWPSKHIDSIESEIVGDDIGKFAELRKSDVLAIRSLRNLHEIRNRAPKSRRHRKFADF